MITRLQRKEQLDQRLIIVTHAEHNHDPFVCSKVYLRGREFTEDQE